MTLDPRTVSLMGEVFTDQVCCVCRRPALRLRRRKFFCMEHVPQHPHGPLETREARDPKVTKGLGRNYR